LELLKKNKTLYDRGLGRIFPLIPEKYNAVNKGDLIIISVDKILVSMSNYFKDSHFKNSNVY